MDIKVTPRMPSSLENAGQDACQVIFLFSNGKLKGASRKIDNASEGAINSLFHNGDFSGDCAQTLMLYGLQGTPAYRVLLVGLGDAKKINAARWREATYAASKALIATPASSAISDCLGSVSIDTLSPSEMAAQLSCDLVNAAYVFTLHSRVKPQPIAALSEFTFTIDKKSIAATSMGVQRGVATGNGMSAAKDLGNLAPNLCTPTYLATTAEGMANAFEKLETTIVDEDEMASLGMGALLAVSRGSKQAGKLIVMNYQGRKRAGSPVILVGKGVTFDTGGISIKPSESMDEMKYDMCGAASVFGVIKAVAELDLDMNVMGIVAAAENMPDGDAARPGDVITSMSGQTIEILNTDAEGRLVLCDALTYSQQFKPAVVVDMATLTGACVTALGNVASAVMGNHQATIDALIEASEQSGDRCWPLPLWDDYQKQLDSNFADMANIGGRPAGAITAACFLSRFATEFNWAHLDIAGIAWHKGENKGASGRPVPLLMRYLFNRLDK